MSGTRSRLAPPTRPDASGSRLRRAGDPTTLVLAGLTLAAVALVVGRFLSFYARSRHAEVAGIDTYWYVWRAKLVAAEGLEALQRMPAPELDRPHVHRAGYPLLVGSVRSLAGIPPFQLVFALPAALAGVVGLAAGAFARGGFRLSRWTVPVFVALLGTSLHLVAVASGRADSLLAAGLLLAAGAAALTATAASEGGLVAAGLLLGAAAVVHPMFAALFAVLLLATGVALIPSSMRARREGRPWARTASGRLGLAVLAGAVVASAALLLVPAVGSYGDTRPEYHLPLAARALLLPVFAPVALLGFVFLVARGRDRPVGGALLALLWALTPAAAAAAIVLLPDAAPRIPTHRILLFALGIPLLVAAGVVGTAQVTARLRPRVVGAALAGLIGAGAVGGHLLIADRGWPAAPRDRSEVLRQARSTGRYLASLPEPRPLVFVVDLGCNPTRCFGRATLNVIRTMLPPAWTPWTYAYMGDPRSLLAGRPDLGARKHPDWDVLARSYWDVLEPVLDEDTVIVALDGVRRPRADPPPGVPLAPGVTLVQGPGPPQTAPLAAPRPETPSPGRLVGMAASFLLLLFGTGLGWSWALLRTGWWRRVTLAPALGAAVLILSGLAAARVGLDGPGPRPWIVVGLALAGWATALARARWGREGPPVGEGLGGSRPI